MALKLSLFETIFPPKRNLKISMYLSVPGLQTVTNPKVKQDTPSYKLNAP